MHIRFNFRYVLGIIGLASIFIVACGGSAPSAAPTVAATSTAASAFVAVAVTPVPPTTMSELEPAEPVAGEFIAGEPALVVFKVTDRSVEAPEFIPAGLTTIRLQNDGSVKHRLAFMLADPGRSAEELEDKALRQNYPATWVSVVGGLDADVGESNEITVRLQPGTYGAVDWSVGLDKIPHSAWGVYVGFDVSESESADIAWSSGAKVIELYDFSFSALEGLTAGRHNFRLINRSEDQGHEMSFVPLDEGQSASELFKDYRYEFFGGKPIENLKRAVRGGGEISPGREIEFSVDLEPGNYAVVCLVPTGHPGTPHVNLGMLAQITVSE